MANKNLIKRAFSVTANLPTNTGRDPALSEFPLEPAHAAAAVEDPMKAAPGVGALGDAAIGTANPPTSAAVPRTGPGSMMAFMAEQSIVHQEVVRLRERVNEFEGAEVARRLDPRLVKPSAWANRDDAHFETDSFEKLKLEIKSAGGNVQPIKVRPIVTATATATATVAGEGNEEGEGAAYEIVFGHRRHRACLELGIPVFTLIQPHMRDADLFVEMERENRDRADLSAWEQGVMYARALEQGLFPSAKQLALAIDRDMSNISRAMALARLPADVVKAFGSPLNLQFRWATPLKDAHQRDPEGLLQRARELASGARKLAPAEVFAELTRVTVDLDKPSVNEAVWKDSQGAQVATMRADRKHRITLSFEQPMAEKQRRDLIKAIDSFLGIKS